jgi:hypothetical protein
MSSRRIADDPTPPNVTNKLDEIVVMVCEYRVEGAPESANGDQEPFAEGENDFFMGER